MKQTPFGLEMFQTVMIMMQWSDTDGTQVLQNLRQT